MPVSWERFVQFFPFCEIMRSPTSFGTRQEQEGPLLFLVSTCMLIGNEAVARYIGLPHYRREHHSLEFGTYHEPDTKFSAIMLFARYMRLHVC